jgi:hypothetical protein
MTFQGAAEWMLLLFVNTHESPIDVPSHVAFEATDDLLSLKV